MPAAIEPCKGAEGRINIAIIAGQLVVGGAERQLYLWLANRDRERYNPIVITLHPGHGDYWEKPIEDLGISIVRIRHRKNRPLRLYEIIKCLRPHHPKLIHGWHLFASAYAGMAAKTIGTKSIGGVRNTYQTFKHHRLETWLTLRTVDALVANSQATAQQLATDINPKRQQVFAVQNAIVDDFLPRDEVRGQLIQAYHLPPDALWIGSMGRMEPLKRFDWLLHIMAKLAAAHQNIHLVLVGDGPERNKLEALARDLGLLNCVTFTGEVPLASTWLKALDLFAFPSVDEGMPNVILEAAAAGLPIVAWQLPFYEELLSHEQTALLVEPQNQDQMIAALKNLIASSALRNSLGQAARNHILASFSIERYVNEMTRVYETVLGNHT